ncbi:hypothetical protein WJX72_003420 [[Myrmecia] bisecta]|uniref:Uncharacterized protein n=1 Tax=[Myrmecia] bisecta TaxID=41462 RepID=A0AAW1R5U8_9CHLO
MLCLRRACHQYEQPSSGAPSSVLHKRACSADCRGLQPSPRGGRVVCSFFDKQNNQYNAIHEQNLNYATDYAGWRIAAPAPLGGSCPSLKLSDPACVPCPPGSLRTGSPPGCLPNPGGMFFADPSFFPVGFQMLVQCSATVDGATGFQNTWTATIIPDLPPQLTTFIPGPQQNGTIDTASPGDLPLQLVANQPFPVTVQLSGLKQTAAELQFSVYHSGQVICSYSDHQGNDYFAIQSVDLQNAMATFTTDPTKWSMIGAAPLGGNCGSLKVLDAKCVPCSTNSVVTGEPAGCLPHPGGILFADVTRFPVGSQVGVQCQFQPAPKTGLDYLYQAPWTATVIQEAVLPTLPTARPQSLEALALGSFPSQVSLLDSAMPNINPLVIQTLAPAPAPANAPATAPVPPAIPPSSPDKFAASPAKAPATPPAKAPAKSSVAG